LKGQNISLFAARLENRFQPNLDCFYFMFGKAFQLPELGEIMFEMKFERAVFTGTASYMSMVAVSAAFLRKYFQLTMCKFMPLL
jgi:hypothetical protein